MSFGIQSINYYIPLILYGNRSLYQIFRGDLIEDKIDSKLYICEEPEIVGATGAALYALEKLK